MGPLIGAAASLTLLGSGWVVQPFDCLLALAADWQNAVGGAERFEWARLVLPLLATLLFMATLVLSGRGRRPAASLALRVTTASLAAVGVTAIALRLISADAPSLPWALLHLVPFGAACALPRPDGGKPTLVGSLGVVAAVTILWAGGAVASLGLDPDFPRPSHHLSRADLETVTVGWRREQLLARFGPPGQHVGGAWRYTEGNRHTGPYVDHRFTLERGVVVNVERSGVGCILRESNW